VAVLEHCDEGDLAGFTGGAAFFVERVLDVVHFEINDGVVFGDLLCVGLDGPEDGAGFGVAVVGDQLEMLV
jgi:hypothetical protein